MPSTSSLSAPALSYYLQQLESFTNPVPDLASTLMSNVEDDGHPANDPGARSRREAPAELSPSRNRPRGQQLLEIDYILGFEESRPSELYGPDDYGPEWPMPRWHEQHTAEFIQDPLNLRRLVADPNNGSSTYEGPPQHHHNRIYSWAPSAGQEAQYPRVDPLHAQNAMFQDRLEPDDSFWNREEDDPMVPFGRDPPEGQADQSAPGVLDMPPRQDNSALVTAALLQSVRRQRRLSLGSRPAQILTRDEESSRTDTTPARASNPASNTVAVAAGSRSTTNNNNNNNNDNNDNSNHDNDDYHDDDVDEDDEDDDDDDDEEDDDDEQHRIPAPYHSFSTRPRRPSPRLPPPARIDTSRNPDLSRIYVKDTSMERLKEAIQYLDRVRFSNSYEESFSTAAAGGFVHLDYFLRNEDDFILNTGVIAGPAYSSWLSPGTVFSGWQKASPLTAMLPHRLLGTRRPVEPAAAQAENQINVYTGSGRSFWATHLAGDSILRPDVTAPAKTESWPVKVTIHHVDYHTMTLSGTMEAYNIPDKSPNEKDAHIVTFLEGEIIDFNTHTLGTKNFNAGSDIDSCYWRELEPFKKLSFDELVKNLVSKKWVTEQLSKGWILMRWKERCFVSPSHTRQGLTICGFYYISLHRETGHIEGMYYDPGSSPYQQLSLDPISKDKMVFPAYNFR